MEYIFIIIIKTFLYLKKTMNVIISFYINIKEYVGIFKNKVDNLIFVCKNKCINNNKTIIIFFPFFILVLIIIYQQLKIKCLNKKIKNLDNINALLNQENEFIFSYMNNIQNDSSIYQLIRPKDVKNKKKVRIGNKGDGGYVLLNDFKNIKIAYSFGICDEISFEKELSEKNIEVFMHDHTIQNISEYNPKLHWKKIGLTGKKGINENLKTLKELLKENGHILEKDMILKMDIEGSEWDSFLYMSFNILRQFKYIVVEFHFFDNYKSIYSKVFKKLNKTHQIFHLHCNNCGQIINFDEYNICNLLEISFVIREENIFVKSTEKYPLKDIDYKNCNSSKDINQYLNIFNFNINQ